MLLFQDGSSHEWLVTLDDATSEVYSMFLVEEGTASSSRGLAETIARRGLFPSFYTDRGSHYFHTPEARAKVAREPSAQVGRALSELRIEDIPRGRTERLFGTLQKRLPPLLRLREITTVEAANRFLTATYMAEHNARFAGARRRGG